MHFFIKILNLKYLKYLQLFSFNYIDIHNQFSIRNITANFLLIYIFSFIKKMIIIIHYQLIIMLVAYYEIKQISNTFLLIFLYISHNIKTRDRFCSISKQCQYYWCRQSDYLYCISLCQI